MLPRGFYTVESFIGRGGMGAVYKGTQTVLKRPVAIKIMRQDQALDAEFRLRFLREAQTLARLNHPGVVNVIDCGEAGLDFLFIVMEFVDGANLMDVIQSGGVSEARALTIMKQVCEALQFAHAHGIVHRDIKPSNIILMRDGRIKLADFGLATQMEPEDGQAGDADQVGGTPAYAAPEQFAAGQSVDQRADIYALGVMIYQMLTGELPRGDWKPPSQAVAIDPAWDKIVSQALQPLPQDRLNAADAMQAMLSHISPLTEEHIRRRTRPRMMLAASFVVLAVALWMIFGGEKRDSNYPKPKAWMDATPELVATAALYQYGSVKDRWLEIRKNTHLDLADSLEFGDVAMRVTYSGAVSLGLRGTLDEYYVGEVRPNGDAIIGIATTNVVEHPDIKPVKFSLGKSYDSSKEHEMVFAAQGDTMRLWLDGRELVSFKDSVLTRGRLFLRVRPKPESPLTRVLRLEYAPLGAEAAPAPRPVVKFEPGSIAHRLTSPDFKWTAPVNLGPEVNSAADDGDPHISPDGLILTFASSRDGFRHFYECRRSNVNEAFGAPQKVAGMTSPWAGAPWITSDRRTLLYVSGSGPDNNGGAMDLYMMQRIDPDASWGDLTNLKTVNSITHDQSPCLSSDGLTLYFASLRGGGYGGHDLWRASRKTTDAPFGEIQNLGPAINSFIQDRELFVATDDRTLLFTRMFDDSAASVLHVAEPDGSGRYQVQTVDLPVQSMVSEPCLSADGGTLWFSWNGPHGEGDRDLWQMQRVPKDSPPTTVRHPDLASRDSAFENTLGMRFVPVPITGGPTDQQRVLFSIWETRVQDFDAFLKVTKQERPSIGFEQGPTHPSAQLSWEDAQAFCHWLTEQEHKAGKLPARLRYRLPLDHEWSCAAGVAKFEDSATLPAKKGYVLNGQFLWGEAWPPPQGVANFAGEEALPLLNQPGISNITWVIKGYRDPFVTTAPVGSFPANELGLYDLSGNVWEWCEDWLDEKQQNRVLRGHSFLNNSGEGAKLIARGNSLPSRRPPSFGLRVVLAEAAPGVKPPAKPVPAPAPAPSLPSVSRFNTPITKATKDAPFTNSLGMKFVPVEVTIGPVAGRYVLYSIWETRVRDYEVFAKETKRDWPKPDFPQGPDHPAVNLTWDDGAAFAQWLTTRDRAAGVLSENESYRLPEDIEWSFAAGVGSLESLGRPAALKVNEHLDVFPWGAAWPPPAKAGNYAGEECLTEAFKSAGSAFKDVIHGYRDEFVQTAPVGSFTPNAIGLHDMGGNVREWTLTSFDDTRTKKVARGGSWTLGSRLGAHSFARAGVPPTEQLPHQGLRVVLVTAYGSQKEAPPTRP